MKQVATYVTKKTGSDQMLSHNAQPIGGTYVRLETEWKEMLKQRHSQHNIQASNNSISMGGFPNTGGGGGGGQLGSSSSSNQNFYGGGTMAGGGGASGVGAGGMACGPSMLSMSKQKHKY